MGKINALDVMQHEWSQEAHQITIVLDVGPGLRLKTLEHECTSQQLKVALPDGRRWSACFFKEVIPECAKISYKEGRLTYTVAKKDPNLMWDTLEIKTEPFTPAVEYSACQLPGAESSSDAKVYEISHVKHNWFEKELEFFTVYMYVKNIQKDRLEVQLEETKFYVRFQTSNVKYLSMYPETNENTVFQWTVQLKGSIIPSMSTWLLNPSTLELKLKKREPCKWGGLEMLQDSPGGSKDIVPNKWIPVINKADSNKMDNDSTASPGDSTTVTASKPMCMVPPLTKSKQPRVKVVEPGMTGLENIGNTCFLNSVVQCLANTRELRDYFEGDYQADINVDNPLGMAGQLAVAFAVLLRVLWSGTHRSFPPTKLKSLVSLKATQFSGFAQHDAQEFMAFLLDGLHEDLNRITKKVCTPTIESDGRPDEEVADDAWRVYKLRNDSIIVDLFQGQYRSKLVCPTCNKVSITFDPFLYLSVPLPKKQKIIPVVFFWRDLCAKPVKFNIRVNVDATSEYLRTQLFLKTNVVPSCIRIFEVCKSQIRKFFYKDSSLSSVSQSDLILGFEIINEALAGEPVVQISVTQRLLFPNPPFRCSYCKREPSSIEPKLKRCTKCFRAAYCNQACQRNHWNQHRNHCHKIPEAVGCPFLISMPKSQITYSRLCHFMEAYSRHSVDTFQPPLPGSHLNCSGISEENSPTRPPHSLGSIESSGVESSLGNASTSPTPTLTSTQTSSLDSLPSSSTEDGVDSGVCLTSPESMEVVVTGGGEVGAGEGGAEGKWVGGSTQLVMGQVREEPCEKKPLPLFDIQVLSGAKDHMEKITDEDGDVLEVGDSVELAMDWHNNERMKGYCMVQSKALAYKIEEGENERGGAAGNNLNLEYCIQLFTEPEVLSAAEAWYCSQCKQLTEATKQMSLWRLPKILIVQLKRFSFKNLTMRDKIDRCVDFPLWELDLAPYLSRKAQDGSTLYDLYAIVNHHGSILGGHYTALVRCVDKYNTWQSELGWRLCDDSWVEEVSEDEVKSRAAYVLFYRRRESSSLNQSMEGVEEEVTAGEFEEVTVKVENNLMDYEKAQLEESKEDVLRNTKLNEID